MRQTVDLIYAHPYPHRSRTNRLLFEAVRELPFVKARVLYDLYPDFCIDVGAEQRALNDSDIIVWQHPLYWYSTPALLTLWFEKVLARGWAYGEAGAALHGKRCLWVTTTGGDEHAFSEAGLHRHRFETFVPVVEQTARFCGMRWEPPLVLHGAHRVAASTVTAFAEHYRNVLLELAPESDS